MPNTSKHTILLGGLGGDSHSVGVTILRQALLQHGFHVHFLGTQNKIEDFFRSVPTNAVMISCMDGHAKQYLAKFPQFMQQFNSNSTRWYLGGNPSLGCELGFERSFIEMGFDRVFIKFHDVTSVLELLDRDLAEVEPIIEMKGVESAYDGLQNETTIELTDCQLCNDDFFSQRLDVLEHWKTGNAAKNLDENAAFLLKQQSLAHAQGCVNRGERSMLIQPRSGVALLHSQIELFKSFKASGSHVLSYQVDSFTRNNNYAMAEEAIYESRVTKRSTINGFPVINHGVTALRRVATEVQTPLQTRHSTRDPRLLAEISYAGGVTAFEGGAIGYNIPYYKEYRLDEAIQSWQYVDRLTGLYYEKYNIRLDREFFGTLTGTLIPPCLAIVTGILEAILAVQQGVKSVSLGYAEQGNRVQDIAAIRVMKELATDIIHNLGHNDVQVNTVFHQYMAAFPSIPHQAEELIRQSAVTAKLSGATRLLTKTPVEAFKIPSMADNLHGLALVMSGFCLAETTIVDDKLIQEECEIIKQEVLDIFYNVLLLGKDCVAKGIVEAFSKGTIDVPFSPSVYNRGEAITVRDNEGAVRFASTGNLPFSKDVLAFHQDKVQSRRRSEGTRTKQDYLLVEKDVLSVARGQFEQWPLFSGTR